MDLEINIMDPVRKKIRCTIVTLHVRGTGKRPCRNVIAARISFPQRERAFHERNDRKLLNCKNSFATKIGLP